MKFSESVKLEVKKNSDIKEFEGRFQRLKY